jgi:uncharacterized protein YjeT (DUF2065 family)
MESLVSLIGWRTGGAALAFILAPRWMRNLLADFIKLSDNEMRIIGYVLFGTSVSLLAQQLTRSALSGKIDALLGERTVPAGA